MTVVARKTLRLGLIGFGTVGEAPCRRLGGGTSVRGLVDPRLLEPKREGSACLRGNGGRADPRHMVRAILGVLLTCACASRHGAADPERDPLIAKFRARAPAGDLARFDRLRASTDVTDRAEAAQMVLFQLTDDELFEIGVTEVRQPSGLEWAVAWSVDPDRDQGPIFAALDGAGLPCAGSGDGNGFGVYIRRELFLEARRALLESADVRSRVAAGSLKVVEPRFRLG